MTDSGSSSSNHGYGEKRSRKRRRPKSPEGTENPSPVSETEEDLENTGSGTYQMETQKSSEDQEDPETQEIEGSQLSPQRRPVRRRTRDPKYAVAPRYRSSSSQSKGGFLSRSQKTGEERRAQRSKRTDKGNAWRGEWVQIQRIWWRLRRYLDERYAPVEEQKEKTAPVVAYKSTNNDKKRKPLLVLPASLERFNTDDLAWKVAATAGTLGLALLLLVKLMPADEKQEIVSSVDVLDTKSTLPARAEKPEEKSLPYEIDLSGQNGFPAVVSIPDEPESELELPEEEVVEILPKEPESEIQLDFLRIPLSGKFAKYLEIPEEEPELFAVSSIPENDSGGLAVNESGEIDSIIENTSAIVINEDSWAGYSSIARTDRSSEEFYQGGEIPETKVQSRNHIPSDMQKNFSESSPVRMVNVEIEKIYPREQAVGDDQVYSILIKNLSDQTIDEINVTEFIPSGMKIVDVEPTASFEDRELNWIISELEPRSVQEFKIKFRVNEEGLIHTIAYVQPVIAVASESYVRNVRPKLRLTMLTPSSTAVGDAFPVRYRVTNLSEEKVHDLILATDLPDKIDHRKGRKLKYDIGTLKAGESRDMTLKAFALKPGQGIQTAYLNSEFGNSATVEKNVSVIPASRKKARTAVQPAAPVNNCCCWRISFYP